MEYKKGIITFLLHAYFFVVGYYKINLAFRVRNHCITCTTEIKVLLVTYIIMICFISCICKYLEGEVLFLMQC